MLHMTSGLLDHPSIDTVPVGTVTSTCYTRLDLPTQHCYGVFNISRNEQQSSMAGSKYLPLFCEHEWTSDLYTKEQ